MKQQILSRLAAIALIAAGLLASIVAAVWGVVAALANPDSRRARGIAISFDQSLNAALGGIHDETISSRAYTASLEGKRWGCVLCKLLDLIDKNHCKDSAGE